MYNNASVFAIRQVTEYFNDEFRNFIFNDGECVFWSTGKFISEFFVMIYWMLNASMYLCFLKR